MGTISIEHGNNLYWLGRYTERVFTTLKALQETYDKMLDGGIGYQEYLGYFDLPDIYNDSKSFFRSFLFDKDNFSSVAYSLERAYDNGIVLREDISSGAFSFLQIAKDTLKGAKGSENTRFALSVGDADNIDRFDAYRIHETLNQDAFLEMRFEDKTDYLEKRLLRLRALRELPFGTKTAEALWRFRIDFYTVFIQKLADQMKQSKEVTGST